MQDTTETSDTSSELTAAPGEPLARPSAPERSFKWGAAIGASGSLHAALAAAFLIAPAATLDFQDAMNAEGADRAGSSVVGSATDGQLPGSVNVSLVPPQPARPQPPAPSVNASQLRPSTAVVSQPAAQPLKQPRAATDILAAGTTRSDLQSPAPTSAAAVPPTSNRKALNPTTRVSRPSQRQGRAHHKDPAPQAGQPTRAALRTAKKSKRRSPAKARQALRLATRPSRDTAARSRTSLLGQIVGFRKRRKPRPGTTPP